MNAKYLFNAATATGTSLTLPVHGSAHTIHVVASGTPALTLTIYGGDGNGNATIIDTKTYSADTSEDVVFQGIWDNIYGVVSSYTSGTITVTYNGK